MLENHVEVGSTASTYEIIAKLATGGMADIFLARTESGAGVERYVVLKRVLRHRATDIKFVHMFLDEAKLASQLQHPNIAQVYDTGKLGDSYFFTMEYVHGETVRELLHRAYAVSQKIPLACALTIVAGAVAGLQHAHERVGLDGKPLGIVHRDVSPSNLMISFEGNVKLVDFGVAKASLQSIETQSGTVKGKIGYMAPEQCRGGMVDARCDLFSLGIVMWELLTGERLFKRATEFESMEAIVTEASPAPSKSRPEIPPSIDAIVLKLLARKPADRFQTAEDVLEAIEAAAVGAGIALSVPALRRFVRELFGQRPEPWVEMRLRQSSPEIVTVTAVPAGKPDTAELQLERVLDLSSPSISIVDHSAPNQPPPIPRRTPTPYPRPPTTPTVSSTTAPARPSTQHPMTPDVRPRLATPNAGVSLVPLRGDAGELAVATPAPQIATPVHGQFVATPSGGLAIDPAARAVTPAPFAAQGSHSSWSDTSHPSLAPSSESITPLRSGTPWKKIGIACGVIAIGIVIGVVAFRASDSGTSADPVMTVHAPTPAIDKPAIEPDTSAVEPVAPADPKPDVTVKPTKPETKPTKATKPTKPTKPEVKPEVKPEPKPDPDPIATSFRANKFADVVTACSADPDAVASHAVVCSLAACRQHDADKAREWITKASVAEHDAVVTACAKLGTALIAKADVKPPKKDPPKPPPIKRDPTPPKPKCDPKDPMDCRR